MTPILPLKDFAAIVRNLCRPDGETEWIEYKRNYVNPEEVGRYISALANGAALNEEPFGYLMWGVVDKTGELVGTTFDPKTAKKGNEPLETWLLRLLNPKIQFGFHVVEVDDNRIVVAEVHAAVNVPVIFRNVDYIRVGSVTKPLREVPERERALWRIFDKTPYEGRVNLDGMEASDALGLLDWPAYFRLLKFPVPQDLALAAGTLSSDGLLRQNEANSWGVANLGALLFAEDLGNFPVLARKTVRVIQYPGKSRMETTREHVFNSGYASGFERLIDYMDALLPSREVIHNGIRENVAAFPNVAVRELIANMLIHQDLAATGTGPMVEVFADRIEISNPGESLVAAERMIDAPPRSRNEAMAGLMRRIGICEERGSGIDKAMLSIELAQLPPPLFETPPGATRVTVFARRDFKEMSKMDRIRAVYQHSCLRYIMGEKTTNATLRERFGISNANSAVVSRLLGDALKAGVIVIEDEAAGFRSRAYIPFWAAANKTEQII
ncbi:MAG: transcriptional regulator [Gammaproteobacteria bacterium]|nr:transcriptional regulator [Gammaproteobacteria bacterium]MYF59305.1 transcriptional regulator [Gammaproteobacteria bacterium]